MAQARPHATRARRLLRLLGWNVLLLGTGVLLIGVGAEAWLRSTSPFPIAVPETFVHKVGMMRLPNVESAVRIGGPMGGFWQRSRSNSLGFLDREPPTAERAARSCHIAMIGDSFVEAREVPVAAKFHVRLEEIAARQLPALDITTSAYGIHGTGQINQLPLYDEYARRLTPKLVVLVFFARNDYVENSRIFHMLWFRAADCRWTCATRGEDGALGLLPPSPAPSFAIDRALRSNSYLWSWLRWKYHRSVRPDGTPYPLLAAAVDEAVRGGQGAVRDYYAGLYSELAGHALPKSVIKRILRAGPESAIYRDGVAITAFALDEFQRRATRDGAQLAILPAEGDHQAPLREMAAERGIPIIDLADYVRRQGGSMQDANFWATALDWHWNRQGHQWAAEALLEYLSRNRHVCDDMMRRPAARVAARRPAR